ncbi:unnamed protein product [Leuciscus chuanchicus]
MEVCGQADAFEIVQVKEGEVLNLHPGVDLTEDDQIQWSYVSGNLSTRIAKMNRGEIDTHYDERFAGRVQIDKTGVLTISNIRTNETGLFEAFIIINKQISEKKFNVEVLGTSHGNTTTTTTPTTPTTPTTHPQMKDFSPRNEDYPEHCGVTEVLVRSVLSGLVVIATAVILVEHLCCSVRGRIQSSV